MTTQALNDLGKFSPADQDFLASICERMRQWDELDELVGSVHDFIEKNHGRLGSQPKASAGYIPQKEPGSEGGPDDADLEFYGR